MYVPFWLFCFHCVVLCTVCVYMCTVLLPPGFNAIAFNKYIIYHNVLYTYRLVYFNRLTPNDPYMGRTAPLTSKHCFLYIYSTNIGTEYFKHALYSPFFLSSKCSLFHNANFFGSCIIQILYTGCAKIKINNSGPKWLTSVPCTFYFISTVDCKVCSHKL